MRCYDIRSLVQRLTYDDFSYFVFPSRVFVPIIIT